ncbi:hypothetical protein [Kribbella sp. NPDC000426]|uniref:hypothetical protein n=1 Tax=Kribbella sp. NPDC000426 TaxID=3154255 RepID=UPI0033172CB4
MTAQPDAAVQSVPAQPDAPAQISKAGWVGRVAGAASLLGGGTVVGVFHPMAGVAVLACGAVLTTLIVITALYGNRTRSRRAFRLLRLLRGTAEPPAPPRDRRGAKRSKHAKHKA